MCGRMEVNRVPMDFHFFPERARGMVLWSEVWECRCEGWCVDIVWGGACVRGDMVIVWGGACVRGGVWI